MNMPTAPLDIAFAVFTDDVLSEEGLGFPNGASYVADEENAQTARVVWSCLNEGRPAILVGTEEHVVLIEPVRPPALSRLRNRLLRRKTVQLSHWYRRQGKQAKFQATRPVRAELGRRTLAGPAF